MTRFRAVAIHDAGVDYFDFGEDCNRSAEMECQMRTTWKNVESKTIGDIRGPEFIVIYYIPKGAN